MTLSAKVTDFLEREKVHYEIISHPKSLTAVETAVAEHVPVHLVAKVVMVKANGKDVMVVIPANRKVNLFKLGNEVGTYDLHIEEEWEFRSLFPDCELGGMPPFGCLYQLPCYVDAELLANRDIVFNGGSHEESIRIAMRDFLSVAKAALGDFSTPA